MEDRGDDGSGLWNAQPFKQPPAVPLPDCPAGCMRAHPVLVRVPYLPLFLYPPQFLSAVDLFPR